jgi:hypothetical protein
MLLDEEKDYSNDDLDLKCIDNDVVDRKYQPHAAKYI